MDFQTSCLVPMGIKLEVCRRFGLGILKIIMFLSSKFWFLSYLYIYINIFDCIFVILLLIFFFFFLERGQLWDRWDWSLFFFFFGKQTISLNKLSNYNRIDAHPVKINTIQIILKNITNVHRRTYKWHKVPFLTTPILASKSN